MWRLGSRAFTSATAHECGSPRALWGSAAAAAAAATAAAVAAAAVKLTPPRFNRLRDAHFAACSEATSDNDRGADRRPKRLVIAGLGDAGLTTAVHLAAANADLEIVGVTPKSCHHSAQELGGRLAQPALWSELYLLPFDAYRRLDSVKIIHGHATGIDLQRSHLHVSLPDGSQQQEPFGALLIATGCTNGFWRTAEIATRESVEASIHSEHKQVAAAEVVGVVGAGPSGVSAAYNIACRFPTKKVHLFCSRDVILPGYHPRVQQLVQSKMEQCGVSLHFGHRARLPEGFEEKQMSSGAIAWSSGQQDFAADLIIWTIGQARPNSQFIPAELLNEEGFVAVDEYLRVVSCGQGGAAVLPNVFAVGDIAATDPGRTSARNNGFALVGHNISTFLRRGQAAECEKAMKRYQPPSYRWGSILGLWDGHGMGLYFASGKEFFAPWWIWIRFWPLAQRFLWAGMRNSVDWAAWCRPVRS